MSKIKRNFWGNTPYIKCLNCSFQGKSKYVRPGSGFAEFLLWCTIIFGIFYSIYRNKQSGCICPKCRSDNVIAIKKDEVSNKGSSDTIDTLTKLGELREKGIITEEEFDKKKAELLG